MVGHPPPHIPLLCPSPSSVLLTPVSLSPRQLTTVAEKSRVLQLEEELNLRRGEIEELQQCLLHSGPPPTDHPEAAETLRLRERLLSASKEHQRESGVLRDKYEKALRAYQA